MWAQHQAKLWIYVQSWETNFQSYISGEFSLVRPTNLLILNGLFLEESLEQLIPVRILNLTNDVKNLNKYRLRRNWIHFCIPITLTTLEKKECSRKLNYKNWIKIENQKRPSHRIKTEENQPIKYTPRKFFIAKQRDADINYSTCWNLHPTSEWFFQSKIFNFY